MNIIAVVVVAVFLGTFSQSVAGFGLGLIIMPILSAQLTLGVARPLVALIAMTVQLTMLIRLRQSIDPRTIGLMGLMGLFGIPAGIYIADSGMLNERVLLIALGVLVTAYALYGLLSPRLPELKNDRYLGLAAFLSGILTGAYNVGGPPVIVYADARRWTPEQVRTNLQGFFVFKYVVIIITHAMSGNFTPAVWQSYVWVIPSMVIGLALGFALYGRINNERFRTIVLVLLAANGAKMLFDLLIVG